MRVVGEQRENLRIPHVFEIELCTFPLALKERVCESLLKLLPLRLDVRMCLCIQKHKCFSLRTVYERTLCVILILVLVLVLALVFLGEQYRTPTECPRRPLEEKISSGSTHINKKKFADMSPL